MVPIVPNRGLIVDRNGVVLATNYSAYTLEISRAKAATWKPRSTRWPQVVEIQPRDRRRFKRLLDEAKRADSLPIRTKLTDEEVARFMAQRFRFPGVDVKARLFRNYPLGDVGAHLIGYIGRINQAEKKAMDDWDEDDQANYRGTEYIGKLGLEQSYEKELHGTTGFEEVETSAGGRAVRRLNSHPPTPGNTLVLSIDIKLQALVEELFGDRRGALVAIDPRNGEVLAFVSKPTFDPNLFVDGIDVESWRELNEKHRQAAVEPGAARHLSAGLHLQALHGHGRAEQRQAQRRSTLIKDTWLFTFGGHRFGSPETERRRHHGHAARHRQSSNVYFYSLANEMGVDLMHEQLSPWASAARPASTWKARSPASCRPPRGRRSAYKRARAAEVVRGRDHLAGHRPGLQQLHHAADGHRD